MKSNPVQSIQQIAQAFIKEIEAFAQQTHPGSVEIKTAHFDKNKKETAAVAAFLHYGEVVLEPVYLVKTDQGGPKSVLECRVWFSKSRRRLYYTMYDLVELADPNNFKCFLFPYIENAQRMQICFQGLAKELERLLPRLLQVAADEELCAQLSGLLEETIRTNWDKELFDVSPEIEEPRKEEIIINRVEMYRDWERKRFCDKGYRAFLSGDYQKAESFYKKQKKLLPYEQRLLDFMRSIPDGEHYKAVLDGAGTLADVTLSSKGRAGLLPLIISGAVWTIVFFFVYTGIYYAAISLLNLGALYVTGSGLFHTVPLILPALLTGIALAICFRKQVYRLALKKRAQHLLEYDAILNTGSAFRYISALTIIAAAVSLLFTVMSAGNNIAFTDKGVTNPSTRGAQQGGTIPYDQIKNVQVLAALYPDGTEYKKFALMTKDNGGLELSDYITFEEFEKEVLPILKEKDIPMLLVDWRGGGNSPQTSPFDY